MPKGSNRKLKGWSETNVDVRTLNDHIQKVYDDGELDDDSTIRKFRIVQKEGNRNVERNVLRY